MTKPQGHHHPIDEKLKQAIGSAIGRIPSGLFILTARHEDRRTGILASWVQQVSFEPAMVMVAVAKGRPIMPLISESCKFALCQLPKGEKILMRKFAGGIDQGEDPFLGMEMLHGATAGLPILAHVVSYLECDVTCHVDFEGDHDIFIGIVRNGALVGGEPHVHLRENGYRY